MLNTRIIMCALAIAGAFLIGNLFSDRQSKAAGPPAGMNVTVSNTPLPVTVTNPTVPPSTVNVGNPTALAAANAQALFGTPVSFHLVFNSGRNTYSVPVGQRLVIEYVSGGCIGGGVPAVVVTTNGLDFGYNFAIPIAPTGFIGEVVFGHVVKLYADAGSNVIVPLSASCGMTFSGTLVSL
jgi:hypothetical protein